MTAPDARDGSAPGATALDPGETAGLLPTWVATRADLNLAEQQNILDGLLLRRWRSPSTEALLDDLAARHLHRDLFGQVWRWAGGYRTTERNIGVEPARISVGVRDLMDDAKAWLEGAKPLPVDEVAFRFHHRLVQVHPFPNGNGRHARAMTDLLLGSLGAAPFTWGRARLDDAGIARDRYLAALRAADGHDLSLLAEFVRS